MTKQINTFYALDFDRCLGNVEATFNLLVDAAEDLPEIRKGSLQVARHDVEATGGSFSVFEYIKDVYPDVDIATIEDNFLKKAEAIANTLLEPGAIELINFLTSNHSEFCIMSYGDPRWQTLKIIASGLGEIPKIIVPDKKKGYFIANWKNSDNDGFIVPESGFKDNLSKEVSEVVLVDDKVSAFEGLPDNARGYLVQAWARKDEKTHINELPKNIAIVTQIDEIIDLEFHS